MNGFKTSLWKLIANYYENFICQQYVTPHLWELSVRAYLSEKLQEGLIGLLVVKAM